MVGETTKQMLKDAASRVVAAIRAYHALPPQERKKWELPSLVFRIVVAMVNAAAGLDLSNVEKKEAVKEAAREIWAEELALVDIKLIPNWIEPVFDNYIVPMLLSWLIEVAVGLKKKAIPEVA